MPGPSVAWLALAERDLPTDSWTFLGATRVSAGDRQHQLEGRPGARGHQPKLAAVPVDDVVAKGEPQSVVRPAGPLAAGSGSAG